MTRKPKWQAEPGPECWHCGESGHIYHDCKKPKKPSTAQPKAANKVAVNLDNKAFDVSDIESDAESMPKLESVYDSEEEVDSVNSETAKD